jgi:hypothetical protein
MLLPWQRSSLRHDARPKAVDCEQPISVVETVLMAYAVIRHSEAGGLEAGERHARASRHIWLTLIGN